MIRRFLTFGSIAIGLIVAAVVGATAYQAIRTPIQVSSAGSLTPENCSPGPCVDVKGFTLWVSEVKVEGGLVSMKVRFRNSSVATHVSPEDLQLIDTSRHVSGLIIDAPGCTSWNRHEFASDETFGPVNICFRVFSTTRPFILRWSPDLGLFCCETSIKLN
jgi:hypothetical protein